MNDPIPMMNRAFAIWPPALQSVDDPVLFQNPRPVFPQANAAGSIPVRAHWKPDKRKIAPATGSSYSNQPALNAKARRFYPKKKFTRFAPLAPRNTTSFIIRAKRSGGIASLVSPCPVTPAILPTPRFSPSREGLVDMAKEEWGVDGYGSMKGLIRLRSGSGSDDVEGESDVEEHLEVERRISSDLSRFEMVGPTAGEEHVAAGCCELLESRVEEQGEHIAKLEEENLTLKERLFLMEREMGDLRRRLLMLETRINDSSNKNNKNIGSDDNDPSFSDNNNNNNNNRALNEAASENECGDVCSEKSVGGVSEGFRR